MRASDLRAGNARPYEFDRASDGERRGDHWSPAKAPSTKRGLSARRADWGSFPAAAGKAFPWGKVLRRAAEQTDEGMEYSPNCTIHQYCSPALIRLAPLGTFPGGEGRRRGGSFLSQRRARKEWGRDPPRFTFSAVCATIKHHFEECALMQKNVLEYLEASARRCPENRNDGG